jgi:D-alanine-D-alanine ligase
MMPRIAVLMGGTSGERDVSLMSGGAVAKALRDLGYEVLEIDIGREVVEQVAELRGRADAAFVALHGRMGEDGTVQGLLELVGIPYTGSGVMASAMAMDKIMSKQLFRANAIPVADDVMVTATDIESLGLEGVAEGISLDLGFPCMVKPNCEGSTLGASRARNVEELEKALKDALTYDERLIVERYIEGRELTVGIIGDEPVILPVLEVVASKGIYDYECKYTKGMTEYIVPALIGEDLSEELKRLALKAHKVLGCEGFSRVDFMLDSDDRTYCLEVNTIPGMTELSLVPKAAKAAGIPFPQAVEMILRTARLKTTKCLEQDEE